MKTEIPVSHIASTASCLCQLLYDSGEFKECYKSERRVHEGFPELHQAIADLVIEFFNQYKGDKYLLTLCEIVKVFPDYYVNYRSPSEFIRNFLEEKEK